MACPSPLPTLTRAGCAAALLGLAASSAHAAETSFHAAGYGNVGLDAPVDGDGAGFGSAAFNPIFLWREGDRILLQNELAISDGADGVELALEYATVDLDVGGPVLSVGKFLSPGGQFISRLHPSWINRLPDFPLPYRLGVTPMSHLGASAQYAVHVGPRQKLALVAYVTNGVGTGETGTPELAARPSDLSGALGYGGRLGVFVLPELEFGASGWTSAYGIEGESRYTLLIGDVALTEGEGVDVRGEYLRATWGDDRVVQGAWAQAALRLVRVQRLRWFEPVARFGWADGETFAGQEMDMAAVGPVLPISAGHDAAADVSLADDPSFEVCVGLNAWLRSNVVAKVAYVHRVEVYEPTVRAQLAFGY